MINEHQALEFIFLMPNTHSPTSAKQLTIIAKMPPPLILYWDVGPPLANEFSWKETWFFS